MKKWIAPLFLSIAFFQAAPLQDGRGPANQELLNSFDEVLKKVVALRQLELLRPVDRGIRSRDEIRGYILERLHQTYPPGEVETEGRVLKKLGLIPPEMDFGKFMVDLMTEQVAGYYDPYSATFYIADWIPIQIQKPVMAHELTHVLQDQHYDLKPFLEPIEGNDDRVLARSAVVEGDGLAVMLQYMLQPLGMEFRTIPSLEQMSQQQSGLMAAQFPVFASAPTYLKAALLFPYTNGAAFLQIFLRTHEWKELDSIYQDLPVSSEQILHPEKYFEERDEPVAVSTDWLREALEQPRSLYRNVLGEFTLRKLLEEFLDPDRAASATTGWNGDQVELVVHRGGESLLLSTAWDSPEDANEFFTAYLAVLTAKYAGNEIGPISSSGGRKQADFVDGPRHAVLRFRSVDAVDVIETEADGADEPR